ncbi:hypothetical protein MC7420_7821 [Coleofasciculus chthonoplastes PCC 7420]|uniref:Uncharacterized protein n=1 Tax=Coleofasciculus chthonoplastes PCC 7420 TaxID=118168 RepID=B4VJ84_9CYAN|nr:hypothetical protein MC7420_7821 [Coleofasciculus chthonoplastes PCC 7420]
MVINVGAGLGTQFTYSPINLQQNPPCLTFGTIVETRHGASLHK